MIAEVIVDVLTSSLDKIFDYIVPDNLTLTVGYRVLLPFGNRQIEGYVIKLKNSSSLEAEKLKPIIKVLDNKPLILPELIDLIYFMKQTFNLRMVDVIRLVLPSQIRSGKVKEQIKEFVLFNENMSGELANIKANAQNQINAINYVKNNGLTNLPNLRSKFGASSVNALIKKQFLIVSTKQINRSPLNNQEISDINVTLTNEQQNAVNIVLNNQNKVHLLYGVTGSGKTEIYMRVISEMLNQKKSAIMLVPEISLTPKTVRQFRARFGNLVAVLHSGLSAGEKFDEWNRLRNGEATIAIGARSAIFAPLTNIGVIIIDEEHDSSYKSDSNPRYDTHTVAKFRAKANACPLILGSATPMVESYYLSQTGEYNLITLKNRVNNAPMPPINIVDMTREFRSGNTSLYSSELIENLTNTINAGEQAILFLNRRGFSSFLMCKECGYVASCSDCDVSLVYHKEDNMLKCHYCGKRFRVLTKCPVCGNQHLKLGNTGTEKVVQELKEYFPKTKILRMDNDTISTKDSYAKILTEFEKSKPAILVGTQMIAKGHDFPLVTLVGILDADLSLFFCDFMATEKTFQLITQVAGRAGRGEKQGKVILQTFFPKHYVYNLCLNYDYTRFYNKEINLRETTAFPPFSKIVRVLITSETENSARDLTHELFLKLKNLKLKNKSDFYFLEAMRSPLTKIKNKFRFQILMRVKNENENLMQSIFECVGNGNQKVSVFVEINPQNLS